MITLESDSLLQEHVMKSTKPIQALFPHHMQLLKKDNCSFESQKDHPLGCVFKGPAKVSFIYNHYLLGSFSSKFKKKTSWIPEKTEPQPPGLRACDALPNASSRCFLEFLRRITAPIFALTR